MVQARRSPIPSATGGNAIPIHTYAAAAAGTPLEPFEYEPEPRGGHEIAVAVRHCGICHGDLHLIDNDRGSSSYPLAPGHEVVGEVNAALDRVPAGQVRYRVVLAR